MALQLQSAVCLGACVCVKELAAVIFLTMINGPIQR